MYVRKSDNNEEHAIIDGIIISIVSNVNNTNDTAKIVNKVLYITCRYRGAILV
jgi:hypothetical protein